MKLPMNGAMGINYRHIGVNSNLKFLNEYDLKYNQRVWHAPLRQKNWKSQREYIGWNEENEKYRQCSVQNVFNRAFKRVV